MDVNELIPKVRVAVTKVFEITNPDAVGLDEDLTLHGFDSLKMAELAAEFMEQFGFDPLMDGGEPMIDLDDLTIRGLSNRIAEFVSTEDSKRDTHTATASVPSSIPRQGRLHASTPFEPIRLVSDDRVPNSMLVILGYDYDFGSELSDCLVHGLEAFPHLAGRLSGTEEPWAIKVEPSDDGVAVEFGESPTINLTDLGELAHEDLARHFLPDAAGGADDKLLRHPLLAVKSTRISNGASVLGLLISHALVDGKGLAWFLQHCTADLRQMVAPEPMHCRDVLSQQPVAEFSLPPWYSTEDAEMDTEHESDLAKRYGVSVFSVRDDDLQRSLGTTCGSDNTAGQNTGGQNTAGQNTGGQNTGGQNTGGQNTAGQNIAGQNTGGQNTGGPGNANPWFQLAAFLARELRQLADFDQVAMWCDVRGRHGIPQSYTGNVGCYWHEPIVREGEGLAGFANRLQKAISGGGMSRVADVYQATKQAESAGHTVRWLGTAATVLPINLVPYSLSPLDFGAGGPKFARILNRNLHGLRISRDPSQSRYIVEACLPGATSETLVRGLRHKGLVANSILMES